MEKFRGAGAAVVTLITAGIAIWWLFIVAGRIGLEPVIRNGAVAIDQFSRAKDILLVVLPLFSASVAYWVGVRGTEKAHEEAEGAKRQLDAVLDQGEGGLLKRAQEQYPEVFRSP